jgi:hypothetical protein
MEILMTILITILLPIFSHKLANEITGYNQVYGMCNENLGRIYPPFNVSDFNNTDSCWHKRESLMQNVYFQEYWIILFIGIVSVFASFQFLPLSNAMVGVKWGGVLTIISAIVFNWQNYREIQKFYIIASSLAISILYGM